MILESKLTRAAAKRVSKGTLLKVLYKPPRVAYPVGTDVSPPVTRVVRDRHDPARPGRQAQRAAGAPAHPDPRAVVPGRGRPRVRAQPADRLEGGRVAAQGRAAGGGRRPGAGPRPAGAE